MCPAAPIPPAAALPASRTRCILWFPPGIAFTLFTAPIRPQRQRALPARISTPCRTMRSCAGRARQMPGFRWPFIPRSWSLIPRRMLPPPAAGCRTPLARAALKCWTAPPAPSLSGWIMTPCISAAAIPPIYTASCGASRAKSPPAGSAWSAPPASTKPCPSRIPTTCAVSGTTSLYCSGSAAPNRSLPIKCPVTAWPAVILPGSRTPVMTLCCTTPSPPKAGGYTA